MPRKFSRTKSTRESEESYWVSMTDVLVGLLFIFIILVVFFALLLGQELRRVATLILTTTSGEMVKRDRGDLAITLAEILRDSGYQGISPLADRGILTIPGSSIFASMQYEIEPGSYGETLFATVVAQNLNERIECWAYRDEAEIGGSDIFSGKTTYDDYTIELEDGRRLVIIGENCLLEPRSTIQTVMIEGHTDSDPIIGAGGDIRDNLELSAQRALSVYRLIIEAAPLLTKYYNREGDPVLSFSGYGADRPIAPNDTPDNKDRNRRIDLRFIMDEPIVPDLPDIFTPFGET